MKSKKRRFELSFRDFLRCSKESPREPRFLTTKEIIELARERGREAAQQPTQDQPEKDTEKNKETT